jgi:23S rRNA (cytosine1962-C5)-methyltransferase
MPSEEIPQRSARKSGKSAGPIAAVLSRTQRPARVSGQAPEATPKPQRRIEPKGSFAVVSRRAADRLRAGHVWVYRSDLERIVFHEENSRLIAVLDPRGAPLGTALYSTSSQIALRLIETTRIDESKWIPLLRERISSAIRFRKELLGSDAGRTNACRLVFSEGDFLPGMIADKYGDLVVLQLLTQGMDTQPIRSGFLDVVNQELSPRAVFERADPRICELEHLPYSSDRMLSPADAANQDAATVFKLNGLKFHFAANSGQKTGAFLDQRENYAAAEKYCHGEALDVCTYQGGFALHLARTCKRVTGVDASRDALEVADQNLLLNQAELRSEVDWIEANAFDLLRDWSTSGTRFDSIVLDPPAFAKSKRASQGALRGYKELNLRALKMLRPGGTLVTCSCSHHVGIEEFTSVVSAAAGDAHRRLRLLERRGAASDHPVLLNVPETEYLKCLICRVE